MSNWPLPADAFVQAFGDDTANSRGTSVAGNGATANTPGSWVQLIATTAFDAVGVIVGLVGNAASSRTYLVDVGIGGAGSEQVVIPDVACEDFRQSGQVVYFPVRIPRGVRVAARVRASATTSNNVFVTVHLVRGGFAAMPPFSKVISLVNQAASEGVVVIPSASANTMGSWAQLTASLSADIEALMLILGPNASSTKTAANGLLDIGFGAAGSEVVTVKSLPFAVSGTTDLPIPTAIGPFPFSMGGGTRLAARAQLGVAIATQANRDIDVAAYGFVR